MLTLPEKLDISSIFGTLNFLPLDSSSTQHTNQQFKPDDDDFVFVETPINKINKIDRLLSLPISIPSAPKKTLLWQLDYKSVPYYVRTYNSQLFVCDKYGLILFTNQYKHSFFIFRISISL